MTASVRDYGFVRSGTVAGPGAEMTIQMPVMLPRDHVYVLVVCYARFATTTGPCAEFEVPEGWTLSPDVNIPITESATVVGRIGLLTKVVEVGEDTTVTMTCPLDATTGMWWTAGFSVKDVGGAPGHDAQATAAMQVSDIPAPAMPVHSSDSRMVASVAYIGTMGDYPWINSPYNQENIRFTTTLYKGGVFTFQTPSVSANVAATPTIINVPIIETPPTSLGWYVVVNVELLPLVPATVTPITSRERRLRLGCAEDYTVMVTGNDYSTVIDGVGWSDLEWSRSLDEPSTATVTIPDRYGGLNCCAHLGGLVPWRYGIRIERDDQAVWSGPVTQIQRQPGALRLNASDILARFQKRLAIRESQITFAGADAGTALAAIILSAQIDGEPWRVEPPEVNVNAPYSRVVSVMNFELAWDIMQDLAESAVDFWIGNGVLYVFEPGNGWMYWKGATNFRLEGPYDSNGELRYGTFTESNFSEMPTWSINGWAQGNAVWVPGPDVGETGARRFWTASNHVSQSSDGVLDIVEQANQFQPEGEEEPEVPEFVMQRFADSLIAQRSVAPAIMEGGSLSQNAPIDVDNLRPGSIWTVDIFDNCYGQLLQATRLKRVTVRAARGQDGKVLETVSPTLYPVGFEGS